MNYLVCFSLMKFFWGCKEIKASPNLKNFGNFLWERLFWQLLLFFLIVNWKLNFSGLLGCLLRLSHPPAVLDQNQSAPSPQLLSPLHLLSMRRWLNVCSGTNLRARKRLILKALVSTPSIFFYFKRLVMMGQSMLGFVKFCPGVLLNILGKAQEAVAMMFTSLI